jgi:hypothetical protein
MASISSAIGSDALASLKPAGSRSLPSAAAAAAGGGEFQVNASDIASAKNRLKKVECVAAKVSRDGTATMAFKNGERVWRLYDSCVVSAWPYCP